MEGSGVVTATASPSGPLSAVSATLIKSALTAAPVVGKGDNTCLIDSVVIVDPNE